MHLSMHKISAKSSILNLTRKILYDRFQRPKEKMLKLVNRAHIAPSTRNTMDVADLPQNLAKYRFFSLKLGKIQIFFLKY